MSAKIEAYFRIARLADTAQRRINTALDRLDARVREAAKECAAESGHPADWIRVVENPMHGPEFVSYAVSDDFDRGGMYPNTSHAAIVYDLGTGAPVDWIRLLPAKLTGAVGLTEGPDHVRMFTLASPGLYALYAAGYNVGPVDETETECRQIVSATGDHGSVPLLVGLDAAKGGLALRYDLIHVEQACSRAVVIPIATLRREGASPRLLAALKATHRSATSVRRHQR